MPGWKRPETHPVPRVWRRMPGFVIQDLTPEFEEKALALITKIMTNDEPIARSLGVGKDEQSTTEFEDFERQNCISSHLSLVCIDEKTNNLAGVNMLHVTQFKNAQEEVELFDKSLSELKGEPIKKLFKLIQQCYVKGDPYKHFGVDTILDSLGLGVHPDYRQYGIGKELVWARNQMAKEFGIPVTKSIYSSNYSQRIAELSGSEVISVIPFDEYLNPDGSRILGDTSPHTCIKLMAGRIPDFIPPPPTN